MADRIRGKAADGKAFLLILAFYARAGGAGNCFFQARGPFPGAGPLPAPCSGAEPRLSLRPGAETLSASCPGREAPLFS